MAQKINQKIFIISSILISIGFIVLYSASLYQSLKIFNDPYYLLKKQFLFFLISIPIFLFFRFVPEKTLKKLSFIFFILNFLALILVLILNPGPVKRWLYIGSFSIQPAEFFKLFFLLYFSFYLKEKLNFSRFIIFLLVFFLSLILVLIEKSFSNSLILFLIGLSIFLRSNFHFRRFIFIVLPLLLIIVIGFFGASYRVERIKKFISSEDSFWQIEQSKNSFISGSFWGQGFGNGKIKLFLPQAYNDTIFAVIGEEFGFFGSFLVLFIFYLFLKYILDLSFNTKNSFISIYSFGFFVWMFSQIYIHIAVVVGVFPPTGVNLPFFSYGGSFLIATITGIGILLRKS
jgi:cell division protein FtsW